MVKEDPQTTFRQYNVPRNDPKPWGNARKAAYLCWSAVADFVIPKLGSALARHIKIVKASNKNEGPIVGGQIQQQEEKPIDLNR